jgi:hypothetical protein
LGIDEAVLLSRVVLVSTLQLETEAARSFHQLLLDSLLRWPALLVRG